MKTSDRLLKIHDSSRDLGRAINELVTSSQDYDLVRLLKKIEAEIMDVQHNIKLAIRIVESTKEA